VDAKAKAMARVESELNYDDDKTVKSKCRRSSMTSTALFSTTTALRTTKNIIAADGNSSFPTKSVGAKEKAMKRTPIM